MRIPIRLRRPLVVLGVVLSLLAGAATIRATAAWTAAASSLTSKPPSVERLQEALAQEQARSGDLKVQLDELATGSTDLAAALGAARDRIAADAADAEALKASLTAAKAKLASLEKSISQARAAAARAATVRIAAPAAAPPRSSEEEDGDDG